MRDGSLVEIRDGCLVENKLDYQSKVTGWIPCFSGLSD